MNPRARHAQNVAKVLCGNDGSGNTCCVDDADLEKHVDYIHYNPVKHGHVARVADWPYSTFHRYVASGHYPVDWASAPDGEGEFGE